MDAIVEAYDLRPTSRDVRDTERIRHQTECSWNQTQTDRSVTVAGIRVSGYRAGHGRSRFGVAGRSVSGANAAVPVIYPDSGKGAVARARFARNRSSRPGWMAWSERRSSIPRSSRSG